jgi:hypothetical protein
MEEFKVESGIPIPVGKGELTLKLHAAVKSMAVGDSFLIEKKQIASLRVILNKHYGNKGFTVRSIGDKHARCWRTA